MSEFRLKPVGQLNRVLRLALDAKHLAETMEGREAVSVYLILEGARDDLSRVLDRAKKELEP
jgi:hypothetical protein